MPTRHSVELVAAVCPVGILIWLMVSVFRAVKYVKRSDSLPLATAVWETIRRCIVLSPLVTSSAPASRTVAISTPSMAILPAADRVIVVSEA